jgi:glycosyltransferase involved in cell wall biosynthesis
MKKRINVCFYGSYDKNFTSNKLVKRGLEENGVRVIEVNAHVPVTRLDKKQDMGALQLIKRILKKLDLLPITFRHLSDIKECDVIYVGYPGHFDVLPAYLLAKIFRKKLVFNPLIIFYTGFVEEQGILNPNSVLAKLLLRAERMIYQMCDVVLADTPYRKEQLIKLFKLDPKKVAVLPIGADDLVYKYAKKKDTKYFNVMYYGLFSPVHGVEYIIQAADFLRNIPEIRFHLVGNGNKFEAIKKLVEERKLTNVLLYPDLTEYNSLSTLQQADIFFGFLSDHPVINQAIPNKVYQGLALGKTVITADGKAVHPMFIHKKNIYLCKPADAKAIADAITFLYKNPSSCKAIADAGYTLFKSDYIPKAVGAYLKQILNKL